jgi:hypothetical protein
VTRQIKLPESPSVIVRGKCVIICYSDGSETEWGEEKNHSEALKIAKELEIELRAISYVKWHVKSFIQDMRKLLSSFDIDEGLLDSILKDGHAFARDELNESTVEAITLSAKPDLRKKIFEKIYTESYLV